MYNNTSRKERIITEVGHAKIKLRDFKEQRGRHQDSRRRDKRKEEEKRCESDSFSKVFKEKIEIDDIYSLKMINKK